MKKDVVLYTTTGCPLCARYKALLAELGVPYEEKNTTEQPSLLQYLSGKGIRMVPTVFVGDEYIAGYRPSSLVQLLAA
jgi:glutaredoxin